MAAETIGERLKRLREERGLSRSALAARVGVSQNAIQNVENGVSKQPGFVVGLRLSRALGVLPEALAFGGDSPRQAGEVSLDDLDASSLDRRVAEAVEAAVAPLRAEIAATNRRLGDGLSAVRARLDALPQHTTRRSTS